MVNLLVGNKNVKEINVLRQKFIYNKDYNIENVNTGTDTISLYWKINPDILVVDNNLPDMSIESIVNKISCDPIEQKKCNTILTITPDYQIKLSNVSKINKILYKPIEINNLVNAIKEMATIYNTPDIEVGEIDWLLQSLNFNCMAPGYKFMKDAITYCYYNPNDLEFLKTTMEFLAKKYDVTVSRVKDALTSSIRPFNEGNVFSCPDDLYEFLYNNGQPLSLKKFLEKIVIYLIRTKKKGKIF